MATFWEKITQPIIKNSSNNKWDFTDLLSPAGTLNSMFGWMFEEEKKDLGTGIGGGGGGARFENPATEIKVTEEEKAQDQIQRVEDTTNNNLEMGVNNSIIDFMRESQQKQWDREDQIRKETQEREDSAYQRAVEDMKRAGINPNLVNINPAQSGGGITSATSMDYTAYKGELEKNLLELEKLIDQAFEGKENQKDRFTDVMGSVLQLILLKNL